VLATQPVLALTTTISALDGLDQFDDAIRRCLTEVTTLAPWDL
jgi:hypothetical protein